MGHAGPAARPERLFEIAPATSRSPCLARHDHVLPLLASFWPRLAAEAAAADLFSARAEPDSYNESGTSRPGCRPTRQQRRRHSPSFSRLVLTIRPATGWRAFSAGQEFFLLLLLGLTFTGAADAAGLMFVQLKLHNSLIGAIVHTAIQPFSVYIMRNASRRCRELKAAVIVAQLSWQVLVRVPAGHHCAI